MDINHNKTFRSGLVFFLLALLFSSIAYAENSKSFGQHTVYYNAFPTDSLPAQMTQRYQLQRSKNMALVNISVIDSKSSLMPQGVKSKVSGEVKNLMGQAKTLDFKEVHEGKAYYYIAQVSVEHNEVVNFLINAEPRNGTGNYALTFSKKFMTK